MKHLYDGRHNLWRLASRINHSLESQLFKSLKYTKCDWVVLRGAMLTATVPRLRQLVWNVANSIREDI